MRIVVKYKSLWVAIVIAATLVGLYLYRFFANDGELSYVAMNQLQQYAQGSLVGGGLLSLQLGYPILNAVLYVAVVAVGGLLINKFTIQNNLYGEATKLPYIIYTLVCVMALSAPIILMPAIAALLVTLSVTALYRARIERQSSSHLFQAVLCLGAVPLLYPGFALLLPLWILALLITNTHSYRDLGMVLIAMVVPLALGIYLKWQFNSDVSIVEECSRLFASTISRTPYGVDWLSASTLMVAIAVALSFMGLVKINDMSMRYSLRSLLKTSNIWLVSSLVLLALPGFGFEQIAIVATPAAMLLTNSVLFVRREISSYLLFGLLLLPFVVALVVEAVL
ncbi:MAG: hypothetical protein SNH63_02610 [Rikenellaceae bacterium]